MKFGILLSLGLLLAAEAPAATIVSRDGTLGLAVGTRLAVASWTQSDTFTNVNISAIYSSQQSTPGAGTFYLTDDIGPGTTAAANEVASVQLLNVPTGAALQTVFSGLTLGPGTYYLSLARDLPGVPVTWYSVSSPVVTTANGVNLESDRISASLDPTYSPASATSVFAANLAFIVTGDVVVAPEPGTLGLLALAGVSLLLKRRG